MAIKPATPLPFPAAAPFPGVADTNLQGLPAPNTKRWVIRRKAAVVEAVKAGLLSLEQACDRYKLSTEEFFTWQALVEQHGVPGLRVTRLQSYRVGERR